MQEELPPGHFDALAPVRVIILHPGSCNLRLGRASDPLPKTVPHVIAYRTDKQTQADAFVAEVDETRVLRTSSSHIDLSDSVALKSGFVSSCPARQHGRARRSNVFHGALP
jgi:actin-related protein